MSVLVAFLVGTYAWNKGKPKEASMFGGGAPAPSNSGPPAAAGPGFEGVVDVDPALAGKVETTGTLFLIVRNQGMPNQGPPLAVRRVQSPQFPLQFSISGADVMMKGMPFEGPFDVYARLDRDGNAMTKAPGDLTLSKPVSGVKLKTKDVRVVLNKVSGQAPSVPNKGSGGSDRTIQGQIKVSSSLGTPPAGTVFVIARNANMPPVGPPLAVKRYAGAKFPLAFEIGPSDVMMQGMPFEGPVDIYVRLDTDGNAMTKTAGDLSAKSPAKGIETGKRGLVIELDEKR